MEKISTLKIIVIGIFVFGIFLVMGACIACGPRGNTTYVQPAPQQYQPQPQYVPVPMGSDGYPEWDDDGYSNQYTPVGRDNTYVYYDTPQGRIRVRRDRVRNNSINWNTVREVNQRDRDNFYRTIPKNATTTKVDPNKQQTQGTNTNPQSDLRPVRKMTPVPQQQQQQQRLPQTQQQQPRATPLPMQQVPRPTPKPAATPVRPMRKM